MFQLNGKIAAVTGSGSGIGKAIALLFAHQGRESDQKNYKGKKQLNLYTSL